MRSKTVNRQRLRYDRLRMVFAVVAVLVLGEPIVTEVLAWLHVQGEASTEGGERRREGSEALSKEAPREGEAVPPLFEELDRPAPSFNLKELEGGAVVLDELQGKVVLLHFWATWCPPCIEELPSLVALQRSMEGEPLVVVAVSVDEDQAAVRSFAAEMQGELRVAMDPKARVAGDYGASKYPETYLIDAGGTLRARFVGPRDWSSPDLRRLLRELIDTAAD